MRRTRGAPLNVRTVLPGRRCEKGVCPCFAALLSNISASGTPPAAAAAAAADNARAGASHHTSVVQPRQFYKAAARATELCSPALAIRTGEHCSLSTVPEHPENKLRLSMTAAHPVSEAFQNPARLCCNCVSEVQACVASFRADVLSVTEQIDSY